MGRHEQSCELLLENLQLPLLLELDQLVILKDLVVLLEDLLVLLEDHLLQVLLHQLQPPLLHCHHAPPLPPQTKARE